MLNISNKGHLKLQGSDLVPGPKASIGISGKSEMSLMKLTSG